MSKNEMLLGDIIRIELPNEKLAYARVYADATIGVFSKIYDKEARFDIEKDSINFFVGIYSDALRKKGWNVVNNIPFSNKDEIWPPKRFIFDIIDSTYSIYFKGEILRSSKEECFGLEVASVWENKHIVDRILGEDKWTEILS